MTDGSFCATISPVAIDAIFLDLDGVAADFVGGFLRLAGLDRVHVFANWAPGASCMFDALGIPEATGWSMVGMGGTAFWAELDAMPEGLRLWEELRMIAPTTWLTAPPRSMPAAGFAAAGKVQWLKRQFGPAFNRYLLGPDKRACAWRTSVLIDDNDRNVEAFKAAGGNAILWPQHWNRHHAVTDCNRKLDLVMVELERVQKARRY